mmetsp:Transcript_25582/g.36694  ORF Transcript_25582/g.36694 Transcript_25582/m.36694 type:complete len:473 (-) Transcript_25582:2215-3633(-)
MSSKEKKNDKKGRKKRTRSDSMVSEDKNNDTINIEGKGGNEDRLKKPSDVDDQLFRKNENNTEDGDKNMKKQSKKKSRKTDRDGIEDVDLLVPSTRSEKNKDDVKSSLMNDGNKEKEQDDKKSSASDEPPTKSEKKKKKNKEDKIDKQEKEEDAKILNRKEKKALLEKVPSVDEKTGIAYSKMQIRRMLKRVKKGLPHLLSEEEERKLEKERRRAKEEEDREVREFMYEPEKEKGTRRSNNTSDDDSEEDDEGGKQQQATTIITDGSEEETLPVTSKKNSKARTKPIPPDYICQACKNKHEPPHWIYDCPDKVTVRGTNQIAKPLRGHIEPDAQHKVFVSGLPFGVTHKAVEDFFRERCIVREQEQDNEADEKKKKRKAVTCKLVRFSDSGKCRGQAYVSFEGEEMTNEALKLDGIDWPADAEQSEDNQQRRWLSITRMKSKIETKKIARQRKWRERMKEQGSILKKNTIAH